MNKLKCKKCGNQINLIKEFHPVIGEQMHIECKTCGFIRPMTAEEQEYFSSGDYYLDCGVMENE